MKPGDTVYHVGDFAFTDHDPYLRRLNGQKFLVPGTFGVWWGLRLKADPHSPSGFEIPIFGGAHGDLALTEHAGALIGETVAGMAESCIIDLSQIGTKAGERRFMLGFLTALYRGVNVHVVLDEPDMWAPFKPLQAPRDIPSAGS